MSNQATNKSLPEPYSLEDVGRMIASNNRDKRACVTDIQRNYNKVLGARLRLAKKLLLGGATRETAAGVISGYSK